MELTADLEKAFKDLKSEQPVILKLKDKFNFEIFKKFNLKSNEPKPVLPSIQKDGN